LDDNEKSIMGSPILILTDVPLWSWILKNERLCMCGGNRNMGVFLYLSLNVVMNLKLLIKTNEQITEKYT
jgi:hypothetical protein